MRLLYQHLQDLDNIEANSESTLELGGGEESCNAVFHILEFLAARTNSTTPVGDLTVNTAVGSSRS